MAPPEEMTSSMTSLTYSVQKSSSLLVEPFLVHIDFFNIEEVKVFRCLRFSIALRPWKIFTHH